MCLKIEDPEQRSVRKFYEHLEDALFHVHKSKLPESIKVEVDGLLQQASRVVSEAK